MTKKESRSGSERGREKRIERVRMRIYRKKLVSREYETLLGFA